MPDRILRVGILTSERVNCLSWPAEVFYRRLFSVADDFGRYDGRNAILRAMLYPLQLDRVSERDVGKWKTESSEAGLVTLYAVKDRPYLQIEKFDQRLRAKTSKWPPPTTADVRGHPQADVGKCVGIGDGDGDGDGGTLSRARETDAVIPTAEEVVAFGNGPPGIPEDYARHYHGVSSEKHRWIVTGGKLIDWRREIVRWWCKDRDTWRRKERVCASYVQPSETGGF